MFPVRYELNFCYWIYVNCMLERVQGLSMVQAVSLTAEARFRSQAVLCGIYGRQNGARTSRSPGASTSFPSSSFQLYYLISPVDRVAE